MSLHLSIDFEDIAHDQKRDLGLWETGPLRIDALWRSYEEIDGFLSAHGGNRGRHATFFCTGVIASQAPDLIARMAADGHEIACHYYFHDEMDRQSIDVVRDMLARGRDVLQDASGQPVEGFRAPKFRIDRQGVEQYRAVQDIFGYDSSFPTGNLTEIEAFRNRAGLDRLRILPIYSGKLAGRSMRLGGSYLKLFPASVGRRLIADAEKAGFAPHIYLHPYEFTPSGAYRLSAAERRPLGLRQSLYWGLRQNQWHMVGNRSLPAKLARLIPKDGLAGRLCDGPAKGEHYA
ncbi:polysaccharide deacetylase family protein [Paracoccus aerodenitrificans]|uniref:polysaccharide deacetylase family protein n=1 Tax=Paracoccus aerodenitrificans TaxID=3017781 RepID=UPI0022EFF7F5|nr:polysaccharide deacetylase family protein [Paracoccus aerodenitrificans]WBU63655.1 polysaccharide deacetylase family protein [Paracoccus aerodenitrificans]